MNISEQHLNTKMEQFAYKRTRHLFEYLEYAILQPSDDASHILAFSKTEVVIRSWSSYILLITWMLVKLRGLAPVVTRTSCSL